MGSQTNTIFWPNQDTPFRWERMVFSGVGTQNNDAQDLLNRLTTVAVKKMELRSAYAGLLLNAQGKTQAYFHLSNTGPQTYVFEFDPGPDGIFKKKLTDWIDLYTFQEKVKWEPTPSDWIPCWVFPPSALLSPSLSVISQPTQSFGRPWLTLWGTKNSIQAELEKSFPNSKLATIDLLNSWQVQSLSAWTHAEILPDSNPLELGLAHAIASDKGCYPGQEVIEKIISLGSPAKRLCLIKTSESGNLFDPNSSSEVGTICRTSNELSLGLLRKTHANISQILKTKSGNAVPVEKVSHYENPAE